jgi:hypothetical protein
LTVDDRWTAVLGGHAGGVNRPNTPCATSSRLCERSEARNFCALTQIVGSAAGYRVATLGVFVVG